MIGTDVAWFKIAGKSSLDFGIRVNLDDAFTYGAEEYETIDVLGRTGTIIFQKNRASNVEMRYKCLVKTNVPENIAALAKWLALHPGYVTLEDSYHRGLFRRGYQVAGLRASHARGIYARFDLVFSCDPRWWIAAGQVAESYTDTVVNQYIKNGTDFEAFPIFEITGSGGLLKLYHGDETAFVNIAEPLPSGGLVIDTETLVAYDAASKSLKNNLVMYSGLYPSLLPGTTRIAPSSGMTVAVTPRWYTL